MSVGGPVVSAAIVGYFLHDVEFGAVKGVKTWRLVSTRGKILRELEPHFECLQSWFMLADFSVGCNPYIPSVSYAVYLNASDQRGVEN